MPDVDSQGFVIYAERDAGASELAMDPHRVRLDAIRCPGVLTAAVEALRKHCLVQVGDDER